MTSMESRASDSSTSTKDPATCTNTRSLSTRFTIPGKVAPPFLKRTRHPSRTLPLVSLRIRATSSGHPPVVLPAALTAHRTHQAGNRIHREATLGAAALRPGRGTAPVNSWAGLPRNVASLPSAPASHLCGPPELADGVRRLVRHDPAPDPLRHRDAHRVAELPVTRAVALPLGPAVGEALETLALCRREPADRDPPTEWRCNSMTADPVEGVAWTPDPHAG